MRLLCLLIILFVLDPARGSEPVKSAAANTGVGAPPAVPYKLLRYDEDWSFLRDPGERSDFLDPIKFVPLDDAQDAYVSFGGEVRQTYEWYDDNAFGAGPQDDSGFLLQRYMAHADFHANEWLRFFGELKSGIEAGRRGGPRPTDEDRLDVHQAFADVRVGFSGDASLTVRGGRQELNYGSSRLITVRNGPNVRQSFDGGKLILLGGPHRMDMFYARPVETDLGEFDDGTNDSQQLWSLYGTAPLDVLPGASLDLYYIGYKNDQAAFDQGAEEEERHSLGSRFFGKAGVWDYNFEAVYQFGDFVGTTEADIDAWTVASDSGYMLRSAPFAPRIGLKANIISGDRDRDDDELNSFNPLFPRGSYFGEIGIVGPYNLFNLHPSLDLHLTRRVTLTADCVFYWRQSTDDGVYNNGGALVRPDGTSDARYVGTQPSLYLTWRPERHFSLFLAYSMFLPGDFIRETGPDDEVSYVRVEASFRF